MPSGNQSAGGGLGGLASGLIGGLLPVFGGALSSLFNRNSQRRQQEAAQREAERQAGFQQKAAFYAPEAVQQRQQNQTLATLQLGRLLGATGGRVPPSLRAMLEARRQPQTFQFEPGAVARQPRQTGGFLSDLAGNLQNFDTEAYNRGRNRTPTVPTIPSR